MGKAISLLKLAMQPHNQLAQTHTDHEAREESIDPAHDQRLRDHHHHIPLQHAHHSLHARRVGHRIRRWLATVIGISQKGAAPKARQ